jgi:hypothetical protein
VEDWSGEPPAHGWQRHGSTAALLCALLLTALALRAFADRTEAATRLATTLPTPVAVQPE